MINLENIYQCQTQNCDYLYDPEWGHRRSRIPPGNLFADVPEHWRCPRGRAGKENFLPLKKLRWAAKN